MTAPDMLEQAPELIRRVEKARCVINAAGLASNSRDWQTAERLFGEIDDLSSDEAKAVQFLNIGPKLAELENLAYKYMSIPHALASAPAPTSGTPIPPPATPPKPTPPSSGTSQWAPSQATPPDPAPVPSPTTKPSGLWDQHRKVTDNHELWLGTHEKKLGNLHERVTALEAKPARTAPKMVWQSLLIGAIVGLLIGIGLHGAIGIVVSFVIGIACFLGVTGAMIAHFNSNRNTASAQ